MGSREQRIAREIVEDLKRGERTEKTFAPLPTLDQDQLDRLAETLVEDEAAQTTFVKIMQALPTLDARGLRRLREALEEAESLDDGDWLAKRGGHPAEDGADPEKLDRAIKAGRFRPADILRDRAERTGALEVD
jgi:hypothetical protein